MTDTVNPRQAGIITAILIMGSKLLVLPSLLFWQVGNQAFFLILFMFLIEFLIIYFVLKLKERFYPLNFYQILKLAVGKYVTKAIYLIFMIFVFLKFIYTFFETYNYLKELVFEDAEIILFVLCVLPVVCSLVYMGLKSFARTAQFFFWFIVFGLIVSTSVSYLVDTAAFPIVEFGMGFLLKTPNVLFWFGDYLFILLFFDKIAPQRNYGNVIMRYVIVSMLLVLAFYFTYFSLFSYTPFLHYFAISDLVQFNVFLGDVWKLDLVALLTVMFLLFFELACYMYSFCECFNKIFKPTKKYISIIVIVFFVLSYVYLAGLNLDFIIKNAFGLFSIIAVICLIIVPLIFILIYILNKKRYRGNYAKVFKKYNS